MLSTDLTCNSIQMRSGKLCNLAMLYLSLTIRLNRKITFKALKKRLIYI